MTIPASFDYRGQVGHPTTAIGHGVKVVTTAGTDVALAASTPALWVTVQAQTDNTGVIAVGGAVVDATVATGTGVLLSAGQSITLPINNLATIYIAPAPQTMIELVLPASQVDWLCRLLGVKTTSGKRVYGCASWQIGGCLIVLPETDTEITPEDQWRVREHEIAHCNGWPMEHPR